MYHFLTQLLEPFPLLFMATGLALANLWRKRRETRRRLLLVTLPFIALTLCCTPAVAYLALGSLERLYPPLHERPKDADAIVVLSGYVEAGDDVDTKDRLADDTLFRCLHALDVYRQGRPRPVLVSGGAVNPKVPASCAALMRDWLVANGVAPDDVIVEDHSRTTYENAVESQKVLDQRGFRKIILVTEAVDMVRAAACFRKVGLEVVPAPCHYRATQFDWSPFDFLPAPAAARNLQLVAHEWLGLAWYRLHGRIE